MSATRTHGSTAVQAHRAARRTVRVATTPHAAISSYTRHPVDVLLVDTGFTANAVGLFDRHRQGTTAVITVDSCDDTMIGALLTALTGIPLPTATVGRPGLSAREVQVLQGICDGMSNRVIACRLTVSLDTVKSHVRRILHKTGADNRVAAAAAAIRNGWVP